MFSLIATDLATNCVSSNAANISVEVTGGPLNVNPVATPSSICRGDSTRLHASAGGGNVGFYQYSWSSTPPGFTSAESDPMVTPVINTLYDVTVTDQFNTTQGNTLVSIYAEPFIYLGPPDTTVCVYDTLTLDAKNPGSTYLWSNGATSQEISFGTTGIGFDLQVYSVEVINEHGCKSSASIRVLFSFDVCVGINDLNITDHIRLFPNPARDMVRLEAEGVQGTTTVSLLTTLGKVLRDYTMEEPVNAISSVNLDLSDLPKGIYFVRLNNSSFIHTQKLVIE